MIPALNEQSNPTLNVNVPHSGLRPVSGPPVNFFR
jgi:hypothetical protein